MVIVFIFNILETGNQSFEIHMGGVTGTQSGSIQWIVIRLLNYRKKLERLGSDINTTFVRVTLNA
jgi:hypothetical protein